MSIGTAAPSMEELSSAKHHFIHHKSIEEPYNVGAFERDGLKLLNTLFKKHNIIIMVGGSGLYVDAVTKGLDSFPEIDKDIRESLNADLAEKGLPYLQELLKQKDPLTYNKITIDNPHRVIRALEICLGTGKPYSSFLNQEKNKREFKTISIGLDADRNIIYDRINKRVDLMMDAGLLDEVQALVPHQNLNALNTVGYKELFNYLKDDWKLDFAISEIKKNTRRFAKRQLTWFRKDRTIKWFDYEEPTTDVIKHIENEISNKNKPLELDESVLDNPVWYALTEHQYNYAKDYGNVKFYKPDYAPFGAFINDADSSIAIEEHSKLIDDFFIVANKPKMPSHFDNPKEYIGLQMIRREPIDYPITETIIELTDAHYNDLIELIKRVYPEFFKSKTPQLGKYFGIYKNNKLVATVGERMQTKNFIEISAVATHPEHTGNGYAKQLITHITDRIFKKNKIPFLHVDQTNTGPIQLYKKLGFELRKTFSFWRITLKTK